MFSLERLLGENINAGLPMKVTVELQHEHPFLPLPFLALLRIGKIRGANWHEGAILNGLELLESAQHVFTCELNDEVHVERCASVTVRVDSDSADDYETDLRVVERAHDGFKAGKFHRNNEYARIGMVTSRARSMRRNRRFLWRTVSLVSERRGGAALWRECRTSVTLLDPLWPKASI